MNRSLNSRLVALALMFALASALLSTGALAETYVATLNGVECEGCKKTITKSLSKLSGVESIIIKKVGEEKHELTVTTDGSSPISQEQASAAIDTAEHYEIQSWTKSTKAPPTAHPHADEKAEATESWLGNGWDKIVGTWQQEDGPTITFGWKYPGKVLESAVKWGGSEKYSVMYRHPETGEISILSTDNKGGHSTGTCTFETGKAVVKDNYITTDGRTGEKVTEYTFNGENLEFRINDGEPRVMSRK